MKKITKIVLLFIASVISNLINAQVTLPPRFNQVFVAGGIISATTMTQAPDGRFFIAQQNGTLLIVKHDTMLTTPFISLNVNSNGERGLLGIAFDPAFVTNQYIYLCYTVPSGYFNRVSRFTASGDTVVPGSEVVIIELDSLIANYHGGGHMDFGPDGKLYICAGENGRPTKAQDLDSYLGKILRINSDGSVPTDNPFPGPGKRQRVWAYGLRNPYTYSFQRGTGRLLVNDVGNVTWEEINDATIGGKNFGWPIAEGNSTDTTLQNPYYTYLHGTAANQGCAITGGAFFNPDSTNYPSTYLNKYFFIDYCSNWINMVSLTNPPVWSNFATNVANYAICLITGRDGSLYFLSRNNQALYRIAYTAVDSVLVVNQPQSQSISLGYPVTLSVTASGAQPMSYQWRKGNVQIAGATGSSYSIPSVAFSDSGNYNVVVTNAINATTSNNADLTVLPNQPPQAMIDTPQTNTFYHAGDTIYFHGVASDPEDGIVPDSSFEWAVVFHHHTHVHPGPTAISNARSGTFIIPNVGETSTDVFYRLYLIVHDHNGAVDSAYIDLVPLTSNITINTRPTGLTTTVDGQPFTAPYTFSSIQGMIRTVDVPWSQMLGKVTAYFTTWNDQGSLMKSIVTPAGDSTYTAYYDSLRLLQYSLGNDTIICAGDPINIDAGANYNNYLWSDSSVNQSLTIQSSVADTITVGVMVTDSIGAMGYDSIRVIVDICSSIGTVQKEIINIFQGSSTGEMNIGSLQENYYLNVTDMTGRVIIANEFVTANRTKTIHLTSGVYSFLLLSEDKHVRFNKKVSVIR